MSPGRVPLRVVVLGRGAIGRPVALALAAGHVEGARLAGVFDSRGGVRYEQGVPPFPADGAPLPPESLPETADLVVEAAGHPVLEDLGARVVACGIDLLAVSVGALCAPAARSVLTGGPGRLYLSTGAIGGLEVIRALAESGALRRVRIETTKRATTLVQPWMDEAERERLRTLAAPVELLRGSPATVARAFPRSANVAASVASAAGNWDLVEAVVRADPACADTVHRIEVGSDAGEHSFQIRNVPSPDNPATSALVPHAVLRAIRDIAGRAVTLI
ncbi:aspartate dehydrogenase domain-containing protein [Actinomadura macra]|uniref:aspartate dehydrogenase domain-containing protein n=1 Tax=Actinomadura macra TaxID=46164 RepID=UPI0008320AA9|nr:aspartate dehydrogenase domain-containing protein [Actinomadura macra]